MTRQPQPFVVFAFQTTHEALDAEAALKAAGLAVVPVPTPPALGGLCGLAMRLPPEQAQSGRDVLRASSVPPRAEAFVEDV